MCGYISPCTHTSVVNWPGSKTSPVLPVPAINGGFYTSRLFCQRVTDIAVCLLIHGQAYADYFWVILSMCDYMICIHVFCFTMYTMHVFNFTAPNFIHWRYLQTGTAAANPQLLFPISTRGSEDTNRRTAFSEAFCHPECLPNSDEMLHEASIC